ncbi:glycosyltransferase [Alphaproteobacteria bacterium GH1-50]|uniref:Glycosyltransferase n=2 Tax=Kangsaoukella pontilimi TaxID=2691042 RepID=A0A7C9MWY3_9RHOB|nr:glycosyltransferase [Kangsaoukella pontilimi]
MAEASHISDPGVPASDDPQLALEVLPLVSLVVPVKDEEAAIGPFLDGIGPAIATLEDTCLFEFVFVNDGSTDATEFILRTAMLDDPRIRIVNLSRNFGKDAALAAGLAEAKGACAIPIDVDLQDDPAVIPEMIHLWQQGARIVNARRSDRSSDGLIKRWTARQFYRVFNMLAERPIPADVGDFRLLDRQVLAVLDAMGERARFNKALFGWVGFETAEVEYTRAGRAAGRSQWSMWRLWNFALDGIFASSTRPLRIWSYVGFLTALAGFLYAAFILFDTILTGRDTPGYASTAIFILVFGGLNLFAIGIVGEYVGRIYGEVRARPLYIVRSVVGGEDKT